MEVGKPCSANVWATAASAVSAVKSARTQRATRTEVPLSMILSVATTCCLLPCGSSLDGGGVFEVELPLLHRRGTFNRIGQSREARGNASVLVQESVNGAGRFRQTQPHLFQGLIATKTSRGSPWDPGCDQDLRGDHPGSPAPGPPRVGRVEAEDDEGPARDLATLAHRLGERSRAVFSMCRPS